MIHRRSSSVHGLDRSTKESDSVCKVRRPRRSIKVESGVSGDKKDSQGQAGIKTKSRVSQGQLDRGNEQAKRVASSHRKPRQRAGTGASYSDRGGKKGTRDTQCSAQAKTKPTNKEAANKNRVRPGQKSSSLQRMRSSRTGSSSQSASSEHRSPRHRGKKMNSASDTRATEES